MLILNANTYLCRNNNQAVMYIPPVVLIIIVIVFVVYYIIKTLDEHNTYSRDVGRLIAEAGMLDDYEEFMKSHKNWSEYKRKKAFLTPERIEEMNRRLERYRRNPLHLKMWHNMDIDEPVE